jgi:predicted nucleic acid-binding protein
MRAPRTRVPIPQGSLQQSTGLPVKNAAPTSLWKCRKELLETELERRKQLAALAEAAGSWKDENHPELGEGSEAFIRELRDRAKLRLELTQHLVRQGGILASCPTTITEVYEGLRPEEAVRTERFTAKFDFFPLTCEISKQAGDLLCYWRHQGRPSSLPDTTIAAFALSHRMVLITANQKDFPMTGIDLYPLKLIPLLSRIRFNMDP